MDFFNLGWTEILLILVLAFIVLGPGKLSKFARDLGGWLRKLNKDGLFREVVQTTEEIRNYPRKIINEAMLDMPELTLAERRPEGDAEPGNKVKPPDPTGKNTPDLP